MNDTLLAPTLATHDHQDLPDDPIALDAELKRLHSLQLDRKRIGLQIPDGTDLATADRLRRDWNTSTATDTRRMIAILTKLRKTTAGPARAGGKRAKKLPIDMDAFATSMGLEKS